MHSELLHLPKDLDTPEIIGLPARRFEQLVHAGIAIKRPVDLALRKEERVEEIIGIKTQVKPSEEASQKPAMAGMGLRWRSNCTSP
ncbi:MAG: hypothetical protein V3U27_03955, partial [Candidatus Tectomicrobia bacterium]